MYCSFGSLPYGNMTRCSACSPELTKGGTSHGRKPTEVGHARAVLSRAGASTQEVRALHTLCKALEQRLQRSAEA